MAIVMILLTQSLILFNTPSLPEKELVKLSGGGVEAWSDGGEAWPQMGRFGSHNGTAPDHSTTGGPQQGPVSAVTTLATIEDPEVNWAHFSSSDYGAQGLASVVGDFSNNIEITGEASERCGENHLFTTLISERSAGDSTHSYLSIIDGDTSRKAWEVDLGSTDAVKASPVIVDVDGDGILEILVAYDAQGTFNTELWSPALVCGEAGWNSGGSHSTELLWSYTDPNLGITVPSPYVLANNQVGTQILLGDIDMDGDADAVYSLVNEADDSVVVLSLPLAAGGVPESTWQVTLDHGEIPSDPAWVKIDDTNAAILLTTIDPDDGNIWVWRLDGSNGAPTWGGVSLGNLDGNTDSPHIRLPGPVVAELDGTPGAEMVVTIPTDIDGGSSGDGAEYIGMEVNDASQLWDFRATNGFAEAPPDVFDTDGDGIDDRVCWITWYRVDTDRKGVAGCHDVTAALGPSQEFTHTLDRSSGNPNDEIAVSPPFHLDLDGQGAPETLVAFGRTLWAWDGDSGTQAGIGAGWADELSLPHRAWASPALADLDGDGAIDILIGDTLISREAPDIRPFIDGRGVQFTPSQPDPGETFTATAYIENVGTVSSGSPVDAVLYYDGNEVHRERIPEMEPVAPTGDGNFASFSFDLTAELGEHTATIVVDPYNNLTQSRFDNDEQTVNLSIVEPYDLSISTPVDPPRVEPGSSEQVDLVVSSTGRLSGSWTMNVDGSSLPTNWTVSDTTSGGSTSIQINDGQPWTASITISAPPEALGSDNGYISITMMLDDDSNVTSSVLLPVEANRTRGLSVRGPSGTANSTGYGIPNSLASSWILVENLGNAVETVSNRAWDPTAWGSNLTLHAGGGEVPLITLQPGEQLELHAKLPVSGSAALGDSVTTTLTICIGSGEEEVCRSIELTFVANGIAVHPDNMRTTPTTGLTWTIEGELPPISDNLSWELSPSGMINSGWLWSATGDCTITGTLLSCSNTPGSAFAGTLTLDQPVDAPPQYHPFSATSQNESGYELDFSLQVLQVYRADIEIISPTQQPYLMNVSEGNWVVLRLENPGNGIDEYDLIAEFSPNDNFSVDPGISFSIPSPTYTINAAGLQQVPVEITLPEDTPAREELLVKFTLRSKGKDSVFDSVIFKIEARQDHDWAITLQDNDNSVSSGGSIFTEPGVTSTLTFDLTNNGNFDDVLDIASSMNVILFGNDTDNSWTLSDGTSPTLNVNESGFVELTLTVPELSWNGTITQVTLNLESEGLNLGTFTFDIEVISKPLWVVRATGSDLDVASSGSNISLEIEQRGNLPARAYLSGAIDSLGWNLTIPSDLPVLDPGETAQIEVLVQPPEGVISGPSVEMTIIARNGDGRGTGESILPVRVRPDYDFTISTPTNFEGWLVSEEGGSPRIILSNGGNSANQLSVTLNGLPAGWTPTHENLTLSWGEMSGLGVHLNPDDNWDKTSFTIQVVVTDLGGNNESIDVEIVYSEVAWQTSPVLWGLEGDDKIIKFSGEDLTAASSSGISLEAVQSGWLLSSPNGDGTIDVTSLSGETTLFYSAFMEQSNSRTISCTLNNNRSSEPLGSCEIGNGTMPFEYTILLRDETGQVVTQSQGKILADTDGFVNLTGTSWNPDTGVHGLTILAFSSDGRLQDSVTQQYVIRATGWNVGLQLEETSDGDLNVLISRTNHQIMQDSRCHISLVQDSWNQELIVDITATLAPKLLVARPDGDSASPVNATFTCDAPWDIDDIPSDNSDSITLSIIGDTLPVDSDALYAFIAAIIVIAALWIAGVIKPSPGGRTLPQRTERKGTKTTPRTHTKAEVQTKPEPEPVSDIQLEDDGHTNKAEESGLGVTEIQESLIEIEEEDSEPEQELDEFELRLKKLREGR